MTWYVPVVTFFHFCYIGLHLTAFCDRTIPFPSHMQFTFSPIFPAAKYLKTRKIEKEIDILLQI